MESRRLEPETEYSLSEFAFNQISKLFGKPEIDLYLNAQGIFRRNKTRGLKLWMLLLYVGRDIFFYAFPPFSIILKTLQKIKKDKAKGIIVVLD